MSDDLETDDPPEEIVYSRETCERLGRVDFWPLYLTFEARAMRA
jgi:hypothetical protein